MINFSAHVRASETKSAAILKKWIQLIRTGCRCRGLNASFTTQMAFRLTDLKLQEKISTQTEAHDGTTVTFMCLFVCKLVRNCKKGLEPNIFKSHRWNLTDLVGSLQSEEDRPLVELLYQWETCSEAWGGAVNV